MEWISVKDRVPEVEVNGVKYFKVKFEDGTIDEKPFRNRPSKNILGFMAEENITHWMPLPEPPKD
jgi:hypothetical protein